MVLLDGSSPELPLHIHLETEMVRAGLQINLQLMQTSSYNRYGSEACAEATDTSVGRGPMWVGNGLAGCSANDVRTASLTVTKLPLCPGT